MADTASQLETRKEAILIGGEAVFWTKQLELAAKDMENWLKTANAICERYKAEEKAATKGKNKRFNILFSNTEVLKGALFGRMAVPDVRRRFADQDPVGRLSAEIIERSIIHCNDYNDSKTEYAAAVQDYALVGRGIVRQVYEATIAIEQGKEYVANQEVYDKYIHYCDYRHEPAKSWSEVTWEAFRHKMTRDDLHENFDQSMGSEEVDKIQLNLIPAVKGYNKEAENAFKKAEVWEIWDKSKRQRIWVVPGHDKICKKEKDPYGLEDFWPNDEPLHFLKSNDTLIPQPEFMLYKDQADDLDEIETRISRLTKQLKRRGVYDAAFPELKRIAGLQDNQFIPVEKMAELQASGGLKKAYEAEDIEPMVKVLAELVNQRTQRINSIYEIIGLSDIMRGASDPNETLGAQELKAQFGGSRIKMRQDAIQKFIRNNFRIKAELIAEHFEPEKLAEITGFKYEPMPHPMAAQMSMPMQAPMPQQPMSPGLGVAPQPVPEMTGALPGQSAAGPGVPPAPPPGPAATVPGGEIDPQQKAITPEIIKILRSDKLRSYRIDVETDSTIFEDAIREKEARVEMLTAMSNFVTTWQPVLQMTPAFLPLAFEMLAFGVRGFKQGRSLEDTIEQTRLQLEQAAKAMAANPPQEPMDPVVVDKERLEHEKQVAIDNAKRADRQHQDKMSMENRKIAANLQDKQAARDHEIGKLLLTHSQDLEDKTVDAELSDHEKAQDEEIDRRAAERDAEFAGEARQHEAQIAAQATNQKAQVDSEAREHDAAITSDQTEHQAAIDADAAERDAAHQAERESIKASAKPNEGSKGVPAKRSTQNAPRNLLDSMMDKIADAIVQVGTELAGAIKRVDDKVEKIADHQVAPVEYIRDPKTNKVTHVKKGGVIQAVTRENGKIKGLN